MTWIPAHWLPFSWRVQGCYEISSKRIFSLKFCQPNLSHKVIYYLCTIISFVNNEFRVKRNFKTYFIWIILWDIWIFEWLVDGIVESLHGLPVQIYYSNTTGVWIKWNIYWELKMSLIFFGCREIPTSLLIEFVCSVVCLLPKLRKRIKFYRICWIH